MSPDDLDTKSLEELDAIFADEVAQLSSEAKAVLADRGLIYCSSADAVLPWLENGFVTAYRGDGISETIAPDSPWTICFRLAHLPPGNSYIGIAPTFPHAAVKALVRAERAKKQT